MAVNKVIYNNNTLIDLTGLDITANDVLEGRTTHDCAGNIIIGTAVDGKAIVYEHESDNRAWLELPTTIASVNGKTLIIAEAR